MLQHQIQTTVTMEADGVEDVPITFVSDTEVISNFCRINYSLLRKAYETGSPDLSYLSAKESKDPGSEVDEEDDESNAGINFIQNHPPPPPGTNPRDTTRREQKPSPRDNNCVQKPFPRDKTGSQKPHPRDIKLENSDTISNEKLCRLNK